jgi:hypothetical protein
MCTILLLLAADVRAGEVPREPLDRLWEEHMLQGTSAGYQDGKRATFVPHETPEMAKGSPDAARLTTRGISVQDSQGTELLGLRRGGGWSLQGGLIATAQAPDGLLELYGKRVWRIYPSFLGISPYMKPKEDETYEFFLLLRKAEAQRATLVKKWVVAPNEIKWFVYPNVREAVTKAFPGDDEFLRQQETIDVRGFLKYDSETHEAEVTITGLIHPWVERVKLP